jgi:hypothetical protein
VEAADAATGAGDPCKAALAAYDAPDGGAICGNESTDAGAGDGGDGGAAADAADGANGADGGRADAGGDR